MKLTEEDKWFLDGLLDTDGIEDLSDGAFCQVLLDRIEHCGRFKRKEPWDVLHAYWAMEGK